MAYSALRPLKAEMYPSAAYLFLELAIAVYIMGFGWEYWRATHFATLRFALTAGGLATFWFLLDQIALRMGLWTFPESGSLPFRIAGLPIEEYVLFGLHTVICCILLSRRRRGGE